MSNMAVSDEAAIHDLRTGVTRDLAEVIRHAALFGSVARGDNPPDSDILIEFDPAARVTLFDYVEVKN